MNSVKLNNITIGEGKLVLLGGPCMAETLETCLEVAEFLTALTKELDIQYVFKASYDKANRSAGNTRRGPGIIEGLKILEKVKEHYEYETYRNDREVSIFDEDIIRSAIAEWIDENYDFYWE